MRNLTAEFPAQKAAPDSPCPAVPVAEDEEGTARAVARRVPAAAVLLIRKPG
ncbi:hypothetical protein [Saccharopolyspora sp. NPDC002376]